MRISPNPPRVTTQIMFEFIAGVTLGAGCLDPMKCGVYPLVWGDQFFSFIDVCHVFCAFHHPNLHDK